MDISTKDNDGLKPVDLARENNQEEAFKLLFRVMKSSILVSASLHVTLAEKKANHNNFYNCTPK